MPNCRHYVTVHAGRVSVVCYGRDAGWAGSPALTSLDDRLHLAALDATIPLAQLYQWTPLGKR